MRVAATVVPTQLTTTAIQSVMIVAVPHVHVALSLQCLLLRWHELVASRLPSSTLHDVHVILLLVQCRLGEVLTASLQIISRTAWELL